MPNATVSPAEDSSIDRDVRALCWILVVVSLATMALRLWSVEKLSYDRTVPFLSANDRSRWCTIRALVDHDSYAIDGVLQGEGGRSWDTIDKVVHWGRDHRPHFYSSKPPFLPTLLAWPYRLMQSLTGWNLADDTFPVVRWMLLCCQVLPMAACLWAIIRIGEGAAKTSFARVFLVAAAGFGTYATTFAVTLNNHVPAVIGASVALLGLLRIAGRETAPATWYFLTGFAAAMTAAMELPAVLFLILAAAICMRSDFRKALVGFVPPVLIVAAGYFGTNWQAHGEWGIAYGHRSDGPVIAEWTSYAPGIPQALEQGKLPAEVSGMMESARSDLRGDWQKDLLLLPGSRANGEEVNPKRWVAWFADRQEPLVIAVHWDGLLIQLRRWNNWYEYPGSYWLKRNQNKSVVDRGEANPLKYLWHLTIGHHGVFSLTPIWLLSIPGLLMLAFSRESRWRFLAAGILAITVIVFAFYVSRPIEDRNYGGLCSAPRWFLWLAPVWLLGMIPVLDASGRGRFWWRAVALLLLAASIASAFYASANPWIHPWIYQYLVVE